MSSSRSASGCAEERAVCASPAQTISSMRWSTRSSINILPSWSSGEKIEALQQTVVADPKPETLKEIHALKRQLLFLRRAVWPFRDVMNNLSRSDCPFLQQPTKVFFRDVYDHVVQIVDTIETLREMVSASLDIYLSSVSYRLNRHARVDRHYDYLHAVQFHREHLRNEFRTYAGIEIRVGLSSGAGRHVGGRGRHAGVVQKQTLAVRAS